MELFQTAYDWLLTSPKPLANVAQLAEATYAVTKNFVDIGYDFLKESTNQTTSKIQEGVTSASTIINEKTGFLRDYVKSQIDEVAKGLPASATEISGKIMEMVMVQKLMAQFEIQLEKAKVIALKVGTYLKDNFPTSQTPFSSPMTSPPRATSPPPPAGPKPAEAVKRVSMSNEKKAGKAKVSEVTKIYLSQQEK